MFLVQVTNFTARARCPEAVSKWEIPSLWMQQIMLQPLSFSHIVEDFATDDIQTY